MFSIGLLMRYTLLSTNCSGLPLAPTIMLYPRPEPDSNACFTMPPVTSVATTSATPSARERAVSRLVSSRCRMLRQAMPRRVMSDAPWLRG